MRRTSPARATPQVQVESTTTVTSCRVLQAITPDTFKNDSEVVLGELGPDGFHATSMTAKCPSKYEPRAARAGAAAGTAGPTTFSRGGDPGLARLYLLLAAFVACAYATAASVAGARRRSQRLIESGVGAFYLIAAIMSVASSIIVYAFVAGDYSIKYVQRTSDSVQPLFYKITSFWGGLDGSIMFWVLLLSLFGSAAST